MYAISLLSIAIGILVGVLIEKRENTRKAQQFAKAFRLGRKVNHGDE